MRRRALVRTIACLCLFLAAGAGLLTWLLRREPASYRAIVVPEGAERRQLSGEFSRQMLAISTSTDGPWSETFTARQMNSYFEEDFRRDKPFKLPAGLNSPRIAIKPGLLQLAFRYGDGFWSSVVRVDLNVWLVANEPNVVAVELKALHAGALPVSMQSLLEQIADNARRWNLDVNWYRHGDHPVAIVRFQTDRPSPSVLLQRLELQDGSIVIAGKATDPAPFKSMISMTEPAHP
jgi:hypothetical protein